MPFELYLTRSFVPVINRSLESDLPPLTREDFELLMEGAPLRAKLEDGTRWFWHPSGVPWLSAQFHELSKENTYISLSISYSHNQFLRVWSSAFELALRMAKNIRARIFEDSNFFEVDSSRIEELLSPHGDFVTAQAKFWEQNVTMINSQMKAPLEFPFQGHDAVTDYFLFFLEPEKEISTAEIAKKLKLNVSAGSLSTDRFAIEDAKDGSVLSRILIRPNDNAWQIWPFYWMEPFSRVSRETIDLAKGLHAELGGKLFFRDQLFTDELQQEICDHIDGLGVEFFLWWQERQKITSKS